MVSREDKAFNKLADTFSDDRLNVVQLGYLTSTGLTKGAIERLRGWLHWHDHISENVHIRDDGGMEFIDGEYLECIKRNNQRN